MRSQIEIYDEGLLNWIEAKFASTIPDKALQILFAPPDRPYAERESGHYGNSLMLKKPRVAVARQDITYDMSRGNPTNIRFMGYTEDSKLNLNKVNYPIPINIPYQLSFWTEYEAEIQAYMVAFLRELWSGIFYTKVTINSLFLDKLVPFILDGSIVNETELEPGSEFREIRMIIPLKAETWIYDDASTEVPVIREILMNTYNQDPIVAWDTVKQFYPISIGIGDGVNLNFSYTLPFLPLKGSVVAFSVCGGSDVRGYDDGDTGVISGTGITGLVNYTTGDIDLTFTVAPDLSESVIVESREV